MDTKRHVRDTYTLRKWRRFVCCTNTYMKVKNGKRRNGGSESSKSSKIKTSRLVLPNTLFTVELPFVKTQEALDNMIKMYPEYDPYFIASGCRKERREMFDKLWDKYKPYADSNFLSQIRRNFHQRSWEMYVGNVLLEKKLTIQSQNEGPDFVVGKTAYVECVAPTKGHPSKPDSVPEEYIATTPAEVRACPLPFDKMVLRVTGAIKDKVAQYGRWKHQKWFDARKPFVIAVNTYDLGYIDDECNPIVLRALFGLWHSRINLKTGDVDFSYRAEIAKSNKEAVPVNFFTRKDYSCVSGAIFSHKSVFKDPQDIGADCIFVNNPFADNPVGESFVSLFNHWTADIDNSEGGAERKELRIALSYHEL